jgi:hypothetical protein
LIMNHSKKLQHFFRIPKRTFLVWQHHIQKFWKKGANNVLRQGRQC